MAARTPKADTAGYCFQHRLEEMLVAEAVVEAVTREASTLLSGNLLTTAAATMRHLRILAQASLASLDVAFPTVHRNLVSHFQRCGATDDADVAASIAPSLAGPRRLADIL